MGEPVQVGGRSLTLVGIIRETGSQDDNLLITDLGVAQALLNKPGKATMVEVAALCSNCPIEKMVTQISGIFPGAKVSAVQQVVKGRMHALDQFRSFGLALAGVVIAIEALVVFITVMGSVTERTREIGIFRALGFRRGHVVGLILIEALATAALAGVLAYVAGIAVTAVLVPFLGARAGCPRLGAAAARRGRRALPRGGRSGARSTRRCGRATSTRPRRCARSRTMSVRSTVQGSRAETGDLAAAEAGESLAAAGAEAREPRPTVGADSAPPASFIEIAGLEKVYAGEAAVPVHALKGIDLRVDEGAFIGVMGQSGSGKSTLLSILGGLSHPTRGRVLVDGIDLYRLPGERLADFRREYIGFVFQAFNLIPYLNAVENVMLPLSVKRLPRGEKRERARGGARARRSLGPPRPSSQPALRRRAGARGHRPRARQRAATRARRRAHRQPRHAPPRRRSWSCCGSSTRRGRRWSWSHTTSRSGATSIAPSSCATG